MKKYLLITLALLLAAKSVTAQDSATGEVFDLKRCVSFALENNEALKKNRLNLESAAQGKREVLGALLPQISASSGITYNIQKTCFAMPNFVNSMLPAAMQDPNAAKYMTVTMGMDLSANWGASAAQQIVNFSLFNAVNIAKEASEMAELGLETATEDVIAQTAVLYYGIQVLTYALERFDESISLMDRTMDMLQTNLENGLMRSVDFGQVKVTRTNLETQKLSMEKALAVQENLLKLQMGFPVEDPICIKPIDIRSIEALVSREWPRRFDVTQQLPYKMLMSQHNMLDLQFKGAKYETLPVVNLIANYSMNYMGDKFSGETYHHFPVSMVGLNMKVPIFSGMSKSAKIRKARIELEKSASEQRALTQALSMAYNNNLLQFEKTREEIAAQSGNMELAQEVYDVTSSNFNEGISSLSDLLNANSSLIQSQMNYVTALNNSMKAFIDLRKAEGTIQTIDF